MNNKERCQRYKEVVFNKGERCRKKYKEGTLEFMECTFCWAYDWIYVGLNGGFNDIYLREIFNYVKGKFRLEIGEYDFKGVVLKGLYDKYYLTFLDQSINMIGEMIKKGQICTELFEIEEYDKPRKIVKGGGKLIKEEWWDFGYKKTEINPCEIKDEKELEKVAEEYKKKMKETIRYLWEKHGRDLVMSFLDIVPLRRCDCYEGEIEIE